MCAPGTFCAVECIALSTGDVWEWFVGRWRRKTQTRLESRIKCGNKLGVRVKRLRVLLQEIRICCKHKELLNSTTAKHQTRLPFLLFQHSSNCQQHSNVDPAKEDKNHTTCFALCCLWVRWEAKPWYAVQRCSRWHVGGSGWRRRRESAMWAALANGKRAAKSICNISVHLAGWIQLLSYGQQREGRVLCHGINVWTLPRKPRASNTDRNVKVIQHLTLPSNTNLPLSLCSSLCVSRCAQQKQDEPWYLRT